MTAALFIASIWTRSWRLPVVGVALLLDHLDRRRGHLPGAVPALQGQALGEDAGAGLHRPQHQGDTRGLRHRRACRPRPTRRRTDGHPRPAARRRRDHPGHPAGRPDRGLAHLQAAAVGEVLLRASPTPSTSTATTSTARSTTPSWRCASSTSTACRPTSATGSTTTPSTPTASASSPPTATSAAPTASRSSTSRTSRRSGKLGDFEPRIYFGEQSPDVLHRRRRHGQPPARVRLPGQQRGRAEEQHVHRQGRRARSGSFAAQGCLRAQVPRAELPALGRRQRQAAGCSTTASRSSGSSGSPRG